MPVFSMFPGCLASFGHKVGPVLYWASRSFSGLVPGKSTLGRILAD